MVLLLLRFDPQTFQFKGLICKATLVRFLLLQCLESQADELQVDLTFPFGSQ
jgi:hypothetical protein